MSADASAALPARLVPHVFKSGWNSAKQYRALIDAKVELLTAAYAADTEAEKILLRLAAAHLVDVDRVRAKASRVRSTNAALRCLACIPKRPPPPKPGLDDIEAELANHGG
jgi:hypothetical protein